MRAAIAIQLPVERAEVDGHERFARLHAGHDLLEQRRRGAGRAKHDELVEDVNGPHQFGIRRSRGSHNGQNDENEPGDRTNESNDE